MNYNDLQRMKPYYNTMNYRYNDNIPKALPIIRNNRFDHANITVAPPIPSYYKQNINSSNYYSHLPNIMSVTYSSAEKIAKNFSNNLNNLRNLEEQIADGNRTYNLPKLNQTQNDINYENMLRQKAKEKLDNAKDDENIKEKIDQMRQEAGRIPDYKTEEQKLIQKNKEIMSEEGINTFNKNLVSTLQDYTNNIQKTIQSKNTNDDLMYDMIKKGITSLREDFSKRIEKFNKQSQSNMDSMRKIMQNSANPRLKLLSEHLFSTSDIDQMLRLREKKLNRGRNLVDNRRMSELMLKGLQEAKLENEKNKQNDLNSSENSDKDENNKKNPIIKKADDEIEKIPLDLWDKKRALAVQGDNAIEKKVNIFAKNYFELQPLNRFRSYVFSVMAARRILNIKYMVYKEFKFTSVSYYISNFEDMDIILKKLVYNTVKDPFLEILNNTDMNINLTYDTEDNHETYFLLQDYIQRIINGFNTRFFAGISGEMCNYLSLYITNYSFIPKDFFTTFELVRIRTTETGEFIELNNENRKMILTFYIFIKILLRNIFLELMFNQADRKKLSLNPKLNIKMVVSVFYRSIIKFLIKHCVTRTNLEELENAEDMTAFLKVKYSKREFHLHRFLKKRYFLKTTEVDELPKRVSRRTRKIVSPKSSKDESEERKIRETRKIIEEKKRKKLEKIKEEENKDKKSKSKKDSEDSDKSSKKKSSEKKSNKKKEKEKSESESDDEEEEEESDSEDKSESKDKKTNKTKKSGSKKSDDNASKKKDEEKNKDKKKSEDESDESSDSEESEESSDEDSSSKKKEGRPPPPDSSESSSSSGSDDDEEEEEEEDSEEESKKKSNKVQKKKTKSENTKSDKTKSDKTKSKKSSDKTSKTKQTKKTKKSKKSSDKTKSEESESDEEEEEEEDEELSNDNYKEEREKLMPKRKVSTEKVNGKVKQRLMGEEPKLKIAIRGKDPLKGKDTIKDFSQSDIDNMYFIIENFQSYGDDLDSNEVDLLDRVLYTNKSLEKYYLYANEYAFDPGELIDKIMDKLLEKIQINFSRLDD